MTVTGTNVASLVINPLFMSRLIACTEEAVEEAIEAGAKEARRVALFTRLTGALMDSIATEGPTSNSRRVEGIFYAERPYALIHELHHGYMAAGEEVAAYTLERSILRKL